MGAEPVIIGIGLVGLMAGAIAAGHWRWRRRTAQLRRRLDATRAPAPPWRSSRGLEGVPAPVRRYLAAAVPEHHPRIIAARLRHRGLFNMGSQGERWRSFASDQLVVTSRPGFDWDAAIRLVPGLNVCVHDTYVAGRGWLRADLAGLIRLQEVENTPALNQGELLRFLAEAVWYPTMLLPGLGVTWTPIDASSSLATLADGPLSVSLEFRFAPNGLIHAVRAESRCRMVGTDSIPTPWLGRFDDYQTFHGLKLPTRGEVGWLLPGGWNSYWRGTLMSVEYEYDGGAGARLSA